MNRCICLVDVDEVIADFTGSLKAYLSKHYNFDRCISDNYYKVWNIFDEMHPRMKVEALSVLKDRHFWEDLLTVTGSKQAMLDLSRICDIKFVTAPPPVEEIGGFVVGRTNWLRSIFGASMDQIIIAQDKSVIAGDFFIDDKVKNVEDWIKFNDLKKRFDGSRQDTPTGILITSTHTTLDLPSSKICLERAKKCDNIVDAVDLVKDLCK